MRSSVRRLLMLALVAVASLAGANSAQASFVLKVFDDGAAVASYTFPTGTGLITTGTINTGNFSLRVDANSNSPGNATVGNIKNVTISAVNIGVGSHVLSLALSDQDFSFPSSPTLILRSSATVSWGTDGNTTQNVDKVDFTSYVNTNNQLFDSDNNPLTAVGQVGNAAAGNFTSPTLNFLSPGTIGAVDSKLAADVFFPKPAQYSLSSKLVITLGQGNGISVTGNTNVFPTPEPGSIALLLAGVPAAAVARWMRRRKV